MIAGVTQLGPTSLLEQNDNNVHVHPPGTQDRKRDASRLAVDGAKTILPRALAEPKMRRLGTTSLSSSGCPKFPDDREKVR